MKDDIRYKRETPERLTLSTGCRIIWHPSEVKTYYEPRQNSVCQFRKCFELESEAKEANVYLFADTHYILYVNGKEVLCGPCRSDPRWQYVDKINIAAYLKKGKNVIAAICVYYGYGTGKSINRIPAFMLDCKILLKDNTTVNIVSDESFKVNITPMFDSMSPRVNGCKGMMEFIDLNHDIPFYNTYFDDSMWQNAKGREKEFSPFWNFRERKTHYITLSHVKACALSSVNVGIESSYGEIYENIKKELETINPVCDFKRGRELIVPMSNKGEFKFCLADFSKIRAGYINLEAEGGMGDIIDVIYAEELYKDRPYFDGVSYRPISRFILKDGINHLRTYFNYEAFRYVMIIFRNHKKSCRLINASMLERHLDIQNISEFHTDDEELQKILDISTHTLMLCMQDGFLDSPSREQQQWMGDGRFQAQFNYYVTGDCRLHEKLLEQIAQSQDIEGMTCSRYPDANHNYPPIPSFCLQWICSFGDYYDFTGRTELIKKLWNQIVLGIRWFSAFENALGLLENVPYWNYLDMSCDEDGNESDVHRGGMLGQLNLMYIEALNTVAKLAKVLSDKATARYYVRKSKKAVKSLRKVFWHKAKGAYCDCVYSGVQSSSISESVNALALILLHRKGDKEAESVIKNVFDPHTKLKDICILSPYFMPVYYKAMQKYGLRNIAVSETKRRYAPMVNSGATTVWEGWKLFDEREGMVFMNSACHAWGSAPILLFTELILGIDARKETPIPQNYRAPKGVKATLYTYRGKIDI